MKSIIEEDKPLTAVSYYLSSLTESRAFKAAVRNLMNVKSFAPEHLIQEIAKSGNPNLINMVGEIEKACIADLENAMQVSVYAVNVLHHCSVYYESIGETQRALALANANLNYAHSTGDSNLVRRAHLILAASHVLSCSFTDAFSHNYQAYQISLNRRDVAGTLMALVNTVIVLHMMGLVEDALKLTLHLSKKYPLDGELLACLQLVNASNGMRLSYLLKDYASAESFYKLSLEIIGKKSSYLTDINLVNYKVALLVRLAILGDLNELEDFEEELFQEVERGKNLKAMVYFRCAQSDAYLIIDDSKKIEKSRILIQSLVETTERLPNLQTELLQQLIKIDQCHKKSATLTKNDYPLKYRQMLQVVSLRSKHREFFHHPVSHDDHDKIKLDSPTYEMPTWILTELNGAIGEHTSQKSRTDVLSSEKRVPYDISVLECLHSREPISEVFSIAESWAIAVECALGGDGYNGSRVSDLSSAIALRLKGAKNLSPLFFSACRLYDIGKAGLAFSTLDSSTMRPRGRFSRFSQHTVLGAQLLNTFDDEVLQIAAKIALGHHEWWNGCGYPFGLKGEVIPIEARICSVADIFTSLVFPGSLKNSWDVCLAVDQITTMAGVQFDPQICIALKLLVEEKENNWWNNRIHSSAAKTITTLL